MLVPEIKSYFCFDHEDLEAWAPADDDAVYYWLEISIGLPGEEGASDFTALVATQAGIQAYKQTGGAMFPPPVVVAPYSFEAALREVTSRVESCADVSWFGIQEQLRMLFKWEYEGTR